MHNIVYFHDLPFYRYEGRCFSASFTDEYYERFLSAGFNRVIIVSRVLDVESLSSGYNCLTKQKLLVSNVVGQSYINILKPSVIIRLARLVRSSDLVVLSTPSVNGLFSSILCLLLRRKFVCEVAGDYTAFNTKRFGNLITLFLKYYMPFIIRKAVGATYVTNDLLAKYPNPNALVGSNVNIHRLFPRLDYSLKKPGEVAVGFVGGLVERKGIRTILKAAALLKSEYINYNCRFHFIGGHADVDWESVSLELGVSDLCTFHGMKTRSEIDVLLDTFDLYVQPSFSEGVPRASIEAMSHGLPVIATTLPGFHEILPPDVLIEPGSASQLAEKIHLFANDKDLRAKQGKSNLSRSEDFLFTVMNENRVAFYTKIFNKLKG